MVGSGQQNAASAEKAIQGGEAPRDFAWAEVSVWTKRMLSALGNGVRGGRWYALVDKVFAPNTLAAAWTKVRANKGAAGGGWAEHRTVHGAGGGISGRAVERAAGGFVPTAGRQAGRHPEGRWPDEAVGHSDGQGPHRP